MVEIVQKQSIAETKRNGSRVVMSNDFLKLPEEMILELTSWDDFNISEVDLYQAVKKWENTFLSAHQYFCLISSLVWINSVDGERIKKKLAGRSNLTGQRAEFYSIFGLPCFLLNA